MQDYRIFDKEYKSLNKSQKQAVDAIEGPVMVVAGPGTGKTKVLTLRIANILKTTQVNPENILALTFTNTASFEMRERLVSIIGDAGYRVNIFTFHAFCEHIIKHFSFYFAGFERFKVVDDLERVHIIEDILRNHKFKELVSFHDTFSLIGDIVQAINTIKKEGLTAEEFGLRIPKWEKELFADENIYYKVNRGDYKKGDIKEAEKIKVEKRIAKAKEIQKVYELYQESINKKGLYDFSDMISLVLLELGKNKHLRADLQEQFQYILVDEHQDTNDGQNGLIEILADAPHMEKRPNLFTVGDDKQSIYRFQGASSETFKHFQSLFRDVEIINLKENYRSTKSILEGAHSLILNDGGKHESLNSNLKEDKRIQIAEFSNYKFELLFIAEDISKKIKDGMNPRDIAVLFRSHKHGGDIKAVFGHYKIPYTFYSRDSILGDRNIKNIITILRVVNNPNHEEALAESLLIDFVKLDPYETVKIIDHARKLARNKPLRLFDILQNEKELFSAGVENPKPFIVFADKIKKYMTDSANMNFVDFFKDFLNDVGYIKKMLESETSQDDLLKLDKLFDEIKKRQHLKKDYNLSDFIKNIDSYKKYNLDIKNQNPEIIDGVNLMTAHGSKGLEFEHVYIINATRKNWEKSRGGPQINLPIKDYKGGVEDERRLFYVSMTRAKKGLTISSSETDWEGVGQEVSQFVKEIDPKNVQVFENDHFEKEHLEKISVFVLPQKNIKTLWDKEFLKKLFVKKGLNVTALNNYLDCPKKYLFRNLINLPSTYTPALMFGNLIHGAIEKFFQDCVKEEKILPKKNLINLFKKEIDSSSFYGNEYEKFMERGHEVLGAYYDEYHESWSYNVQTEQYIPRLHELPNGEKIKIGGKIDKIEFLDSEKKEGIINVIDYKTGSPYSQKDKKRRADLDRQINFYHFLLDGYQNGRFEVGKTVLDFLEPNKKGEFEQVERTVTGEDIEDLKHLIDTVAMEIIDGTFLEKGCGKKDCEYCHI